MSYDAWKTDPEYYGIISDEEEEEEDDFFHPDEVDEDEKEYLANGYYPPNEI